jgi:hypothetical protein
VERREFGIHHDDTIVADYHEDVSALAFEHVGLVAEVGGLDPRERGVGPLRLRGAGREHCRRRQLHQGGPTVDPIIDPGHGHPLSITRPACASGAAELPAAPRHPCAQGLVDTGLPPGSGCPEIFQHLRREANVRVHFGIRFFWPSAGARERALRGAQNVSANCNFGPLKLFVGPFRRIIGINPGAPGTGLFRGHRTPSSSKSNPRSARVFVLFAGSSPILCAHAKSGRQVVTGVIIAHASMAQAGSRTVSAKLGE